MIELPSGRAKPDGPHLTEAPEVGRLRGGSVMGLKGEGRCWAEGLHCTRVVSPGNVSRERQKRELTKAEAGKSELLSSHSSLCLLH